MQGGRVTKRKNDRMQVNEIERQLFPLCTLRVLDGFDTPDFTKNYRTIERRTNDRFEQLAKIEQRKENFVDFHTRK